MNLAIGITQEREETTVASEPSQIVVYSACAPVESCSLIMYEVSSMPWPPVKGSSHERTRSEPDMEVDTGSTYPGTFIATTSRTGE